MSEGGINSKGAVMKYAVSMRFYSSFGQKERYGIVFVFKIL